MGSLLNGAVFVHWTLIKQRRCFCDISSLCPKKKHSSKPPKSPPVFVECVNSQTMLNFAIIIVNKITVQKGDFFYA